MLNRISKQKIILIVGSVLAGIIIVTSFALAQGKVLKVAMKYSDIKFLDPHYAVIVPDVATVSLAFNALVRSKPGDCNPEKIESDLAEKWEHSKDGLIWTFHLRKGVRFHKGYGELTADDVKFSLEKAANKSTSGFANDFDALAKVEAIDRYTVRITLKNPVPSVLGMFTDYHGGYIVSKKAVEEKGDNFKNDPVGTGPFVFKEHLVNQKVAFVRHPEFFRGKPKLDGVEIWFMPDSSSREMAFRRGDIDLVEGEQEQMWVEKMRKIPGTIVDIMGPGQTDILHFNITKKPIDDIRVRKAICHAIDREELRAFLGKDVTEKLVSVVSMSYLGGTDRVPVYEFSPEKAKKLLAEAGYPKGLNLATLTSEAGDYRRPMEQIQEQLRRLGINLQVDVVTHAAYHDQIRKDVCPLVLYSPVRFPVADIPLSQFFHSKSIVGKTTAITNFSHYDKIDDLIEKARVEIHPKKQKALWAEAQKRIIEDAVALPLCSVMVTWARKNNVDYGYELKSSLTYNPLIAWTADKK